MPAKSERRYAIDGWQAADFQIRADGDGMTFHGYAAVFDSDSQALPFWGVERIAPGAFTKSLGEARNIRMFLNHNSDMLLASTRNKSLRLTEDEIGLRVEADLPDTSIGRDLSTLLKRGDVDSMSFGFQPVKYKTETDKKGVDRTVHTEVRLFEVSPVTSWPAYDATSAFVRHLADLTDTAPEPLAEALRILVTDDTELTDEQTDLLLVTINARSARKLIAPETAAIVSAATGHASDLEAIRARLGLA